MKSPSLNFHDLASTALINDYHKKLLDIIINSQKSGQYKTRTGYKTRTKHYGLGIKYGLGYKTRTEHYGLSIKHEERSTLNKFSHECFYKWKLLISRKNPLIQVY